LLSVRQRDPNAPVVPTWPKVMGLIDAPADAGEIPDPRGHVVYAPFRRRVGDPTGGEARAAECRSDGRPLRVDDIEAAIRDLTSRGVTFEEYENPKTTNFIAEIGPALGAWFADPDGNVFGIREGPIPGAR
jgi:catechol 2,3-dioxygenase-like lactoylglutathione lyase family enzyme